MTSSPLHTCRQVLIGNEWGTVCSHGWSLLPASLACQQLGWVLNPADWTVSPEDLAPDEAVDTKVLMRCELATRLIIQ